MTDSNWEELLKRFNELETQFKSLVGSLEDGNHAWGVMNASPVIGAFYSSKMTKLNASEGEMIDIYNNSPQILESIAISVSLTAESYQKIEEEIYLEIGARGNYWIIATDSNQFWLFPKENIKINASVMKTVELLFECQGYEAIKTRDFYLKKPAKVIATITENHWKLEERGNLDFTNTSATSQLRTEIQEMREKQQQLQQFLQNYVRMQKQVTDQSNLKIQNRLLELEEQIQTLQNERQTFVDVLKRYAGLLEQSKNEQNQLRSQLEQLKQKIDSPRSS